MAMVILLAVGIFFLAAWYHFRKPPGLPPGRWGLPLIGHLPSKDKYIDETVKDMQKKYGDVYVWKFGAQVQVIVHDYNICKQMFGNQDFINRPDLPSLKDEAGDAQGIIATNGTHWQLNRRFTLCHLRDMGMGKASLISAVHEQVPILLEAIKKDLGKEAPVTSSLNTAIVNIIWKMIADTQFVSDDPRHKDLQQLVIIINETFTYAAIADMFSWLQYFIPKSTFRQWFKLDVGKAAVNTFFKYLDEQIQEHQKDLNRDAPRDLIDAYLIDMEENKEAEGMRSISDLKFLLFDMFFAGSNTTTKTMHWLFLYMAAFPDKQRKLQQEIDKVLQKGILPTLNDHLSMAYTNAVINEVLRKSSLANIGVHHSAVKDTILAGYVIPKNTMITTATMSIHHDERYWDKPNHFLPERWISPEGKFVMQKEGYLPFSIGKRSCIGEGMARMELFVFTVSVFQSFNVAPPEGKQIDLLPDYNNIFGHDPRKQNLVFTAHE